MFDVSPGKLHELDRVSPMLDSAADAVFKNVVGSERLDLAIVSPSDNTCSVSASVTEAHGSARI